MRLPVRAFAALVLCSGAAQAQVGERPTFGETVAVRVVNVDVWVTDKTGRPIEGLRREDFRLFEDGVEVEIANFYVAGRPAPAAAVETVSAGAGEAPTIPLPLLEEGEAVHALVYLDHATLNLPDRARVLEDLRRFAAGQAGLDVRFALVTADRGTRVETPFVSDPAEIQAALDRAARHASSLGQENREFVRAVEAIQRIQESSGAAPSGPAGGGCVDDSCRVCDEEQWWRMLQQWETYAAESNRRVEVAIDNLSEIVASLGGLPGRKALFYVSSGLQLRPGVDLLEYLSDLCRNRIGEASAEMWRYNAADRLEELAARANANRVTLHTLDAAGLRPDLAASVEFSSLKMSTVTIFRRSNLQDSLWVMADRTGGRAILHANEPLPDLERGLEEQSQGYSLGFYPQRPPDDRNHKLRVELRDKPPGATLRFRHSYRDKSEEEKLGDRLMAALRLGFESNPLAVSVAAESPRPGDGREFEVPIKIRVPGERLVTTDPGQGPLVRIFLVAQDEDGGRSAVRQGTMRLAPDSASHEIGATLTLRRGQNRIVVGVRDEIGEVLSVAGLEVAVGSG